MNDPTEKTTLMQFPCDFQVKAICKNLEGIKKQVLDITKRHFTHVEPGQIKANPSKQENYIALSIHVVAESQAQLDALYEELTASENIIMTL